MRVHDSQAHRKMDMTRESIRRTLKLREILKKKKKKEFIPLNTHQSDTILFITLFNVHSNHTTRVWMWVWVVGGRRAHDSESDFEDFDE